MSACHVPGWHVSPATSGLVRRRWVQVLVLVVGQAVAATAAWASFAGQSIYHYQTYRNGWDAREYTDLNAMCAVAVAAYASATGRSISSTGPNENVSQCRYEFLIQSPVIGIKPTVGTGGVS